MECQRDFESEQLTNSEKKLFDWAFLTNELYCRHYSYNKGDDHYHYGFYAKRVLIVVFSNVHVKD